MKLPVKNYLPIAFMTCLFLLGSCGSKGGNAVNSNALLGSNNPIFNTLGAGSIGSQYAGLKSSVPCLPGHSRLVNDSNFYVTGGAFSGTTIGGQWQPGYMPSGSVTNMYVGVSAFGDLMFLTKVSSGGQVVGYNVTLSFCDVANAYPNYPALVSNDRALVNFQAPSGITINTATSCGYGLIAAALNTIIISQRSMTNPYTSDYPIYTSFTSPTCH